MKDLTTAKNNIGLHTICFCKDGQCITDDKRGIAPMMGFIARGLDLNGYSVADKMVGKAVALLFVKCGIASVYAKTLSLSGKAVLEKFNIPFEYDSLVEKVINRDGTDTCPMEKTVTDTTDPEEAYLLLKNKLALLAKNQ